MKLLRGLSFQPQKHLFHIQIYACFLLVLFIFFVCSGMLLWTYLEREMLNSGPNFDALVERLLPADANAASMHKALKDLEAITYGPVAVFAPDGALIASSAGVTPVMRQQFMERDPRYTSQMIDGRIVVFDWSLRLSHPFPYVGLLLMAILAALGSWPLVRYLTRRLDSLRQHADALAAGNLSARVKVHGDDEIAQLARRFNQAAERIESLVNTQRIMLASASHELRSPLARIRMATGLFGDERPELQAQIARDIGELDTLIGDLLLASRLSSDTPQLRLENIDLLGLAAEEARRVGANLSGEPVGIQADARLLRHMLRNLLENARRHAAGASIDIEIDRNEHELNIRVLDRGPGVPASEREKIFEPFYRLPGKVESGEGAGYGLALVRRIARLHGGEVVCQPREGDGACFGVCLPIKRKI
ncbi:MAG: two component sensor histidine kinase protein [Burkholderiaceae bacterium]|nr:two component sensor histidine kinase protein [Burkholderiaceae bacterium]